LKSQGIPVGSVLIRDFWSGLLTTAVALGWFLIGGWAVFGALLIGYSSPAGNELPGIQAFINLSVLSAVAGVLAWLRFRFVYRTLSIGSRTTAVLLATHARGGSAKLTFEYVHENTTYQAVNHIAGGRLWKAGETADIVYDPANPSRAYVWDAYVPGESLGPDRP
jgi:uncharacterized protein DUF3592